MTSIYLLLLKYKYLILFPLSIPEGPIVNVIASFMASLGFMNVFIVYIIIVAGDVIGDGAWYWVARKGGLKVVEKHGARFGLSEDKISTAKTHLHKHFFKTMLIGKITNIVMLPIIIACGVLKVDYKKFMITAMVIDIFKDLIFTLIGFYFGTYYKTIDQNLNNFSLMSTAILLLIIFVFIGLKYIRKRFYKVYEN